MLTDHAHALQVLATGAFYRPEVLAPALGDTSPLLTEERRPPMPISTPSLSELRAIIGAELPPLWTHGDEAFNVAPALRRASLEMLLQALGVETRKVFRAAADFIDSLNIVALVAPGLRRWRWSGWHRVAPARVRALGALGLELAPHEVQDFAATFLAGLDSPVMLALSAAGQPFGNVASRLDAAVREPPIPLLLRRLTQPAALLGFSGGETLELPAGAAVAVDAGAAKLPFGHGRHPGGGPRDLLPRLRSVRVPCVRAPVLRSPRPPGRPLAHRPLRRLAGEAVRCPMPGLDDLHYSLSYFSRASSSFRAAARRAFDEAQERADPGPLVLAVHDEVVAEVRADLVMEALEHLKKVRATGDLTLRVLKPRDSATEVSIPLEVRLDGRERPVS